MDAGYWIEHGILSADECDRMLAALAREKRSRAGVRHLMSSNPCVAALALDERLLEIASGFVGSDPVPFRATLFEKSGEKNWLIAWHQDTALPLASKLDADGWSSWSKKAGVLYAHAPESALLRVIALRVHLDDSASENGPLRVIPGTHLSGVLTDEAVAKIAAACAHVECPISRGGVIAMRPLLIHASSKAVSNAPRRVLHIEYADSLDIALGIRLAVA